MNILAIPGSIISGATSIAVQSTEKVIDFAIPGTKPTKDHAPTPNQRNLYQIATPMLDLSTSIYMITELRRCVEREMNALQKDLNLNEKKMADIKNAIGTKIKVLKEMEAAAATLNGHGSGSNGKGSVDYALNYQKAIQDIQALATRYNMSSAHMDSFEKYMDVLRTPKSSTEYLSDLQVYGSYISKAFMTGFGGEEFQLKSLEGLVRQTMGDTDAQIVHIDDKYDSLLKFGTECCYAIAVSPKHKSITVVFRGSVRPQDFVADLDLNSSELKLPGFTGNGTGFEVGKEDTREVFGKIHNGFNEYLFGKTKPNKAGRIISKSEVIMGKIRGLLKDQCKGYDVYFTGHSLGASLSTLMAFRAVAINDPIITHVKNISFASPLVGDQAFRDDFQKLEKEGKIQHLRISNNEDLVPLIPYSTFPSLSFPPFMLYKHVGMNIRMYEKSFLTPALHPIYRLFYPKEGDGLGEVRTALHSNVVTNLTPTVIIKHLCPEYRKRLDECKEELEKLSLDQLYADSDITGWTATKEE